MASYTNSVLMFSISFMDLAGLVGSNQSKGLHNDVIFQV